LKVAVRDTVDEETHRIETVGKTNEPIVRLL